MLPAERNRRCRPCYEAVYVNYMGYDLLVFGIDKSYILWYSPVLEGGDNHAERKDAS